MYRPYENTTATRLGKYRVHYPAGERPLDPRTASFRHDLRLVVPERPGRGQDREDELRRLRSTFHATPNPAPRQRSLSAAAGANPTAGHCTVSTEFPGYRALAREGVRERDAGNGLRDGDARETRLTRASLSLSSTHAPQEREKRKHTASWLAWAALIVLPASLSAAGAGLKKSNHCHQQW
jgi:hypothetical protein